MDARAEFQNLFDRYVERYLAGDAAGCAAFYAPDGQIHSPFGPLVVGADALAKIHEEWFQEGEINKTIQVLDARAEGDIGYCLARYSADLPQGDGSYQPDGGTSVNTFERLENGRWVIRHTSLNANQD